MLFALLLLGSKSRRLRDDSFIYRMNSLLTKCRSFRVLTKALLYTGGEMLEKGYIHLFRHQTTNHDLQMVNTLQYLKGKPLIYAGGETLIWLS